jgi:GT2 family glycosyltransferase
MEATRVIVVMTVFNRRERTIACLRALHASASRMGGIAMSVCLTDDGGTDGTSEAVSAEFPDTRILRGSGALFWSGGMRKAMAEAMTLHPDYYLWLNDDVLLVSDAIERMIQTAQAERQTRGREPIVVGSTVDPTTGKATYGGRVRLHRFRPLQFSLVEPGAVPLHCETMNANSVLLPADVVTHIGNLDPAFVHGLGDFDYGLRAARAGYDLLVCPGFVGQCSGGTDRGDMPVSFRSLRMAWKSITGPKALPPVAWRTFTQRYAGPFWILYWLKPYANALFLGLLRGGI